jgi:hypothetical protein
LIYQKNKNVKPVCQSFKDHIQKHFCKIKMGFLNPKSKVMKIK